MEIKENIKNALEKLLTDKMYIKVVYKKKFNRKIDLKNPKEFNEKLNWVKLYDRKEIYSTLVDKCEAKKYVSNIIGEEYIIPTLGVYNNFEEINFDKLPQKFVIKTTHDCGGIVVCKDKSKLDIKQAKKKINKHLKYNYFYNGREWPYKNVKPRIIIEEYIEDNKTNELRDYKVYSFNGESDYLMLCFDRFKDNTKFMYFDRNWNMIKEFSTDGMKYGDKMKVERPENLDKMFEFSDKLTKGYHFIRVDWYEADGKLYFGELTLFPGAAFDNKRPEILRKYLDEKLILPKK